MDMTLFEKEFRKVGSICDNVKVNTYDEFVEILKQYIEPGQDEAKKDAIILLGYSGNGKSTWSREFRQKNSEFQEFSWDEEMGKLLRNRRGQKISGEEQLRVVGQSLEDKSDKNIVVDGNYLNLPLRVALINTLHGYGYNVYLADLTPQINETLQYRIDDEIDKFRSDPRYMGCSDGEIRNHVTKGSYDFKADEEKRSSFSEQVRCGAVGLGVEGVLTPTDFDMKEIKASPKTM